MVDAHVLQIAKEQAARTRFLGDASGGLQVTTPVFFIIEPAPTDHPAEAQTAYRPVCASIDFGFQTASGSIASAIARTLLKQIDSLVTDFALATEVNVPAAAKQTKIASLSSPQAALESIQSVLNLTRSDIADLVGITRQTLHAWASGADPNLRKKSSYELFLRLASIATKWTSMAGPKTALPRWSLVGSQDAPGMFETLRKALREGTDPTERFVALQGSMVAGRASAAERESEAPRRLPRRTRLQVLAESIERSRSGSDES